MLSIDLRRSSFHNPICSNDPWRHDILGLVDAEVLKGPLCLCSPVAICRDLFDRMYVNVECQKVRELEERPTRISPNASVSVLVYEEAISLSSGHHW